MPWALLLDYRAWLAVAFAALAVYAAAQRAGKEHYKAELAQYRADVESEAAKDKVRAAREAAQQALNAQGAIDDLQARNAALSAAYERLRHAKPRSSPVPAVPAAPAVLGPVARSDVESDADARCVAKSEAIILGVLEAGDKELAKFTELYRLEQANAAKH